MLKVCYLADSSSIHTKKMCDFFKLKGYEIHVISLNEGYIDGVYTHNFNFNVKELKNKKSINKVKYLSVVRKINKLIKEIQPDILHAHFASSYGLLGSLCKYNPYIISVWGTDIYEFPKKGLLHRSIIKYNLKNANNILSTSYAMAEETSKYTDKEIYITPFGVDTDYFKPLNKVKNNDTITLGTIKTLEERYGIEYLIKAFKIIKDEFQDKDINLIIGGDGSKKNYLMNLAKDIGLSDNIKFIGYVESSDLVETFNSFDIAIFPSLKESFGVAAVEAQACGVPVVATNVGGLPEATYPGKSSILVESKNIEQLAGAIIELINDEARRIKMGINGREYVSKNLNLYNNFDKIDKIYKNILDVKYK